MQRAKSRNSATNFKLMDPNYQITNKCGEISFMMSHSFFPYFVFSKQYYYSWKKMFIDALMGFEQRASSVSSNRLTY